ncbi:acyl-CoA reductase-like NAD-dependent aldehyde dehydrogenase [Bradyrhizobium sp. JR3.5]
MSAHIGRTNRHPALDRISDKRLLRELAYVDGNWSASHAATSFQVTDPATGAILGYVASLDAEQTGEAIAAATRAFPAWKALLPQERSKCLRRWFDLIIAAREDLALIMTLEQGKSLAESRGEIDYASSFVEWYAEEAKRLSVEGVTGHLPGAAMSVVREPVGVVGVVTPWNFPFGHADPQGRCGACRWLHCRSASFLRNATFGTRACRTW